MALFKKKTEHSNIPPELQQYYKPEQRQRMWLAWVVALISLIATVSIVLGLFFGIRALIRKGQDKDQKPTTAQVDQPQNPEEANENENNTGTNGQPDDVPEVPAPSETPSTPPPPATTPPAEQPTAPQPRPNNNPTNVPNTGPGDTAAIFVGVSAAGYAISVFRRKFLQ